MAYAEYLGLAGAANALQNYLTGTIESQAKQKAEIQSKLADYLLDLQKQGRISKTTEQIAPSEPITPSTMSYGKISDLGVGMPVSPNTQNQQIPLPSILDYLGGDRNAVIPYRPPMIDVQQQLSPQDFIDLQRAVSSGRQIPSNIQFNPPQIPSGLPLSEAVVSPYGEVSTQYKNPPPPAYVSTGQVDEFGRPIASSYVSPEGKPLPAGSKVGTPKTASATGVTNQQDIDSTVEGIKSGFLPPDLTKTTSYRDRTRVSSGLKKEGFNLTKAGQEYMRAQKQITALNSSQMMRFRGLGISVVNTINEVNNLAQEMDNRGIPLVNKAKILAYIQGTGANSENGQLAARYIGAVNTLTEEFANLAQGGYAPTEATWYLANQQINSNYDVNKLRASLQEVQRLINYRLQAFDVLQPTGKYGIEGEQRTPKPRDTGLNKTAEQRYNELESSGISDDEIYKILAQEGYK